MSRTLEDPLFRTMERELLGAGEVTQEDANLMVNAAAELTKGVLGKVTAKPTVPGQKPGAQPPQKPSSFLETMKKNALPIGIGAVVLGAVVGLVIYASRK